MTRNRHSATLLVATTATLALAALMAPIFAGTAGASTVRRAQGWHFAGAPSGAFGTVASVNGTSTSGTCGVADSAGAFTVTEYRTSTPVTVDVATTTTFVEPGVSAPTFLNVCVGSLVGAIGSVSDSTVTATKVFVAPVRTQPRPHGVFGTVASVNGSDAAGVCGVAGAAGTFTAETWRDTTTVTVDVTATTTFVEPGTTSATFADVCVGDVTGALGTVSGETVTATKVFVTQPQTPNQPQGAFGTVASVNGSDVAATCGTGTSGTFTVSAWKHTVDTVNVSATTTFVDPEVSSPTFANVCVGDLVGAIGTVSGDTVAATKVFVAPSRMTPPLPQGAFGTVASVNGSTVAATCGTGTSGTFTVMIFRSTTTTDTVNVSATTTYAEPGVSSPTFANVCVGELVGAIGSVSSDTVTATNVFIAPPVTPIVPPTLPGGNVVLGTVGSVNGTTTTGTCGTGTSGSFTVMFSMMTSTTYTVDVTSSTTYLEPGVTSPTFANVCVGEAAGALGTLSADTLTATKVLVVPTSFAPGGNPLSATRHAG